MLTGSWIWLNATAASTAIPIAAMQAVMKLGIAVPPHDLPSFGLEYRDLPVYAPPVAMQLSGAAPRAVQAGHVEA